MESNINDPRFSHIARDPRFRKMKRDQRKVKIDDRFKGMFKDKQFKVKYTVDKRGRPINTSTSENLRKYYDISSDDDSDSDSGNNSDAVAPSDTKTKLTQPQSEELVLKDKHESKVKENEDIKLDEGSKNETSETKDEEVYPVDGEDSDEEEEIGDEEGGSKASDAGDSEEDEDLEGESSEEEVDYARGEGVIDSSSSSSDESTSEDDSDSEDQQSEIDHDWAELDKEAPEAEEITHRLALCNMDWDRLSAQDIMVLLNSFKPTGGVIKGVTIYPSEFGMQRLKEEELKGPIELAEVREKLEKKKSRNENETEGSEFETEKLRQYQLRRLKYYYAVVECDSTKTANYIYTECDGVEYESSANRLDIRFIPNEMTFDQEPKSVATDVDIANYKPTTFVNSALQHSKVECTWDEDDQKRMQITRRKFTQAELETMDLQEYLASDSESDEEPDAAKPTKKVLSEEDQEPTEENEESDEEQSNINNYRKLLLGDIPSEDTEKGGKKKRKRDRGAVNDNNLVEEPDMEMEISWEPGIKENTEKLVADKTAKDELTPWERYLKKKKDKKKQKREERKLAEEKKKGNSSGDEDNLSSDDDIPSDVDLDDPFFKDILGDIQGGKSKPKKDKKSKQKRTKNKEKKNIGESQEEEALDLLMMDEEDQKQHFNLKNLIVPEKEGKTQRKKRLKREAEEKKKSAAAADSFKMNIDDTRFKAIYENPLFNIDPSAPEFKKTQLMDTLITEKVKRSEKKRKHKQSENDNSDIRKKTKETVDNECVKQNEESIDSLVKSVKSKAKMLELKKKSKLKKR